MFMLSIVNRVFSLLKWQLKDGCRIFLLTQTPIQQCLTQVQHLQLAKWSWARKSKLDLTTSNNIIRHECRVWHPNSYSIERTLCRSSLNISSNHLHIWAIRISNSLSSLWSSTTFIRVLHSQLMRLRANLKIHMLIHSLPISRPSSSNLEFKLACHIFHRSIKGTTSDRSLIIIHSMLSRVT